ncbi:MAG: 30S ribosomal protein S2 [Phycisphaerales bacterium]
MSSLVKNLIEAGIHYGHRTAGWNPKMGPYIHGKKNGIHIIDVRQTIKGLLLAKKFITRTVAEGKDVLFIGTKRQARPSIETMCVEAGMPYVIERWLGGTLTNFRTIRARLKRLEELEALMDSPDWVNYSKKMASQLTRERKKIQRNLGGIKTLDRLPGALVIIDVRREVNAVKEAKTLGIPTVCLLDTDGDPDMADIPIPGNDDAMRAIELVVKELTEAAKEGKTTRAQISKERAPGSGPGSGPGTGSVGGPGSEEGGERRRRSSRSQFRAEDAAKPATAGEEPVVEANPAEQTHAATPGN